MCIMACGRQATTGTTGDTVGTERGMWEKEISSLSEQLPVLTHYLLIAQGVN